MGLGLGRCPWGQGRDILWSQVSIHNQGHAEGLERERKRSSHHFHAPPHRSPPRHGTHWYRLLLCCLFWPSLARLGLASLAMSRSEERESRGMSSAKREREPGALPDGSSLAEAFSVCVAATSSLQAKPPEKQQEDGDHPGCPCSSPFLRTPRRPHEPQPFPLGSSSGDEGN